MNYRQSAIAIAITAGLLGAAGAQAAPIASWGFSTSGGFVVGGAECSNATSGSKEAICGVKYFKGATAVTEPDDTSTRVQWGAPALSGGNPSALELNLRDGSVSVGGDFTSISSTTHFNNPIRTDDGYLKTGKISTTLGISADGFAERELTSVFTFDLKETPDSNSCTDLNPYGSNCDDIFEIPKSAFTDFSLRHQGFDYFFEFRIVADSTTFGNKSIPDGAVQEANGDIRIATAEQASTTVLTQLRITATAVPAPGALPLLASGLMLLGWRRRSRQSGA